MGHHSLGIGNGMFMGWGSWVGKNQQLTWGLTGTGGPAKSWGQLGHPGKAGPPHWGRLSPGWGCSVVPG